MKISNSKKELARIISKNGGWRDGAEFAAQDKGGKVFFYGIKPTPHPRVDGWSFKGVMDGYWIACGNELPNWHQTILSRDEYFHLYPAPDAGVKVTVENATTCHLTVTDKLTIEQLAADYRNAKDYADRKQQEADAAKSDAEAKLAELVAVGKALGLVLSVAAPAPELAITDWRDLQVGDEIATHSGRKLTVTSLRCHDDSWPIDAMDVDGVTWSVSLHDWRFIRRPAEGGPDA
jgi:hypothetical protein